MRLIKVRDEGHDGEQDDEEANGRHRKKGGGKIRKKSAKKRGGAAAASFVHRSERMRQQVRVRLSSFIRFLSLIGVTLLLRNSPYHTSLAVVWPLHRAHRHTGFLFLIHQSPPPPPPPLPLSPFHILPRIFLFSANTTAAFSIVRLAALHHVPRRHRPSTSSPALCHASQRRATQPLFMHCAPFNAEQLRLTHPLPSLLIQI